MGRRGEEPSFIGLGINSNNLFIKVTFKSTIHVYNTMFSRSQLSQGIGPFWVTCEIKVYSSNY